ncbi:hypothetical protein Gotur_017271 [Gossypium turneri]
MWMRQSLICLIGSTGGLHQSQQFWQKYSVTSRRSVRSHIGSSPEIICH